MADSLLTPLEHSVQIVNKDGTPTPYLIQWLQQLRAEKAITDALAAGAAVAGDVILSGLTSAAQTIIGNKEVTTGPLEELTITQVLDLLGATAQGDVAFRDAAAWNRLAAGTSGQVLTSQGPGANPKWTTPAAGGGGGGGAWSVISEQILVADGTPTTISGIPSGYRDLILIISGRGTAAATEQLTQVQFNGDTGANYDNDSNWFLTTMGQTAGLAATSANLGSIVGDTAPASTQSSLEVLISNYAGTTFHKSFVGQSHDKKTNATSNFANWINSGYWRNTAAINSITFISGLKAGSVVTLYGRGGTAGSSNTSLIGSQTVSGASVASVSFTAIPGTYKSLYLEVAARSTAATAQNLLMRFNNDTGANYDQMEYHQINGGNPTGSGSVGATSMQCQVIGCSTLGATEMSVGNILIIGYAQTSFQKGFIAHYSSDITNTLANMRLGTAGGCWKNTAAINRIDFISSSGNIDVGSSFNLWGRS